MSFLLLLIAAAAEPTPTPPPLVEIELMPSAAKEIRRDFQEPLTCLPVPQELLHPVSGELKEFFTDDLAAQGSGATLTLIRNGKNPNEAELFLFQGDRLRQSFTLRFPKEASDSRPSFTVTGGGELVILSWHQRGFAVYAGPDLLETFFGPEYAYHGSVEVVNDTVVWCPNGPPSGGLPEDPPTLCFQQALGGGKREPLLSVDSKVWKRLLQQKDADILGNVQVSLAVRSDRRLYVVGDVLADVYLLRASGSLEKHFFLPWALKGIAENQDYQNFALQSAQSRLAERSFSDPFLRQRLYDATKGPRQPKGRISLANFIVGSVFAKDKDLVLTTRAGAEPANALIWLSDDGQTSRCFLLDPLLKKRPAADPHEAAMRSPSVTVTTDRLWLLPSRSYFLWEELESFWEDAQKKEKKAKP
jgi:hypothetical protein